MNAQLCLTLYYPMDSSPPGSHVHGIFQARILESVAISSSRGSSWPRYWTHVSCISCTADGFFTIKLPVQFSRSVVSNSATTWTAARQASLSNTNSWSSPKLMSIESVCHPAISSSVVPFSCPQSLPAPESFPMSQLFSWDGQSIGVSASASVLPMNTQDWFPLEWTGWISLQSKRLSRVFSNTSVQKHQFFGAQLSSQSNSHIHT